jgi:hypothetical protein
MGKTIHVVSDAAGVILKASRDREACEAFIDGSLNGAHHYREHVTTPNHDPATLYRVPGNPDNGALQTLFALTTLRLS